MKKLTFKVGDAKENNVITLVKEVNNISCRLFLDIQNGVVIAENINEETVEAVIELVEKYYTITSIDIENTQTEVTDIEPKFENDLSIKRVEFESEYVSDLINQLLKNSHMLMSKKNISESIIGRRIESTIEEMSMRYSETGIIGFTVGDVVDCNYGVHLTGEINGSHVPAIVCKIHKHKHMAFVVPSSNTQRI